MRKISFKVFGIICLVSILFACVPLKKYNSVSVDLKKCNDEKGKLEAQLKTLSDKNTEQEAVLRKLMVDYKQMKKDTAVLGAAKRTAEGDYGNLKSTYDALFDKNKNLISGSDKETRKILTELQATQEDLQKRDDALKILEKKLAEKEKSLNELDIRLKEKEKRVVELENILNKKDSVVQALRKTVNDALLGYIGKGLTVNIRNGKVYVSLEESLLFASASWQVSSGGTEVLRKLSKVLESNQDINVLIEGHTDNVPYAGASQVKDNWDLSCMRATSVVKILLNGSKINPDRLMATGRSEYVPLDPATTKEARSKNRRTEIILTPKLDELFRILESN